MSAPKIDLFYFSAGDPAIRWELGKARRAPEDVKAFAEALEEWAKNSDSTHLFLWDMALGLPKIDEIARAAESHYDICHAGIALGAGGMPQMLDFVNPNWMFTRDLDPGREGSSWRLSFRSCLIKRDIFRQLGAPDRYYESLEGSALDFGHRCMKRGVFMRHTPGLLSRRPSPVPSVWLSLHDELRFISQQYGKKWRLWAAFRALATGSRWLQLAKAGKKVLNEPFYEMPQPYRRNVEKDHSFRAEDYHQKISVLVPTLERYPYLRNELGQLRNQTVQPLEVIVIDQTPAKVRDRKIAEEFSDLPLKVVYQDTMGQCTAWNEALRIAAGEYVLFLGDDADRLTPFFLENFLRSAVRFHADIVASVPDEVGAGPIPYFYTFLRTSDSLSICLVRKAILKESGYMDLAYDRASRADADLAMRCYLNGAFMVLDPSIRPLHHRAPSGGLRTHKARKITYAASRRSLVLRHLPGVSEIYLSLRYFSLRQTRESLWLRVMGTFSFEGGILGRVLKKIISFFMLPATFIIIYQRYQKAVEMLETYPRIAYPSEKSEGFSV